MRLKITTVLSGIILVIACNAPTKPVEKPAEANGYFIYDNQKYSLNKMFVTGYVVNPDSLGNKFDVYLFADPIIKPDDLYNRNGNTIYFQMYSPKVTVLDTGKYALQDTITKKPFNVGSGFCGINYSSRLTLQTVVPHDFASVIVSVKRKDNTYTLDFEGLLVNSKKVVGHYEGLFTTF